MESLRERAEEGGEGITDYRATRYVAMEVVMELLHK